MRSRLTSPLVLLLSLSSVVMASSLSPLVDARQSHERKKDTHKHQKQRRRSTPPAPAPYGGSYDEPYSRIFDIFSFGAKGDGVTDDSKALRAAWKAACKVPRATVEIRSEFKYLIRPLTLQGPCMLHFALQIDGEVFAPANPSSWSKSALFQWINFKWLHNFTIKGSGTVDGQGSAWWCLSQVQNMKKKHNSMSGNKPTALRFYASYNITVQGITIVNSPLCHLKFDSSCGIKVNNITISSPENSPNTDGIHLQNSRDVEIQHSNIGCGDDCVSIQTGCSDVHVHHINCGPGHGISVGGLGKDNSVACVSNVTVENITVQNTLAGVRIKTWQGGRGWVEGVRFSNILVSDVKIPIMIDQFYCDRKRCKNETGAVEIAGVEYDQIVGTYSVQPIHLACSDASPCRDLDLIDIQLAPSATAGAGGGLRQPLCWNSYGQSRGPLVPATVDCLHRGDGVVKPLTKRRPPPLLACK